MAQSVTTTSGGSRIIRHVKSKSRTSSENVHVSSKRGSTRTEPDDDDIVHIVKSVRGDKPEEREARFRDRGLTDASLDVKFAIPTNEAPSKSNPSLTSLRTSNDRAQNDGILSQSFVCDLCKRTVAFVLGVGPVHHAIACHGRRPEGKKEIPQPPDFHYERCSKCLLYFDKFSFSYHQCQ